MSFPSSYGLHNPAQGSLFLGLKSRTPCVSPLGVRCPPLYPRPLLAQGILRRTVVARRPGSAWSGAGVSEGGPRGPRVWLREVLGAPSPRPRVSLRPPPPARPAPTRARGTRCGRAGSAPGAPRGRVAARTAAAAAAAAAAAPRLPGAAPARPPGALRPPCGAGQARGGRGRGCGRSESGRKRSARPGGGRQEGRRAGQEIPHRLPDPGPAAAGQAAAPAPRARPHPPAAPPPLRAAPAPTRPRANLGANLEGALRRNHRSPCLSLPSPDTHQRSGPCALPARPGPGREAGGDQARRTKAPWPAAPRNLQVKAASRLLLPP